MTVKIWPTYTVNTIIVWLYLASDPDTAIRGVETEGVLGSTTVTVTGLEQGVKYGVMVTIQTPDEADETLGMQYFTAKRSGGQLVTIPVLPTSYGLFDWADWPQSKAALVAGGNCWDFERTCWNAIVDKLYNAIMDAGLDWQNEDTAAEALKMYYYGDELEAGKLNVMLDEIYCLAKFPFAWENDRYFRGYLGRRHFRGVWQYGDRADKVYPEYLLETVRRINLLIQIMRGWGPEVQNGGGTGRSVSLEVNQSIDYGLSLVTSGAEESTTVCPNAPVLQKKGASANTPAQNIPTGHMALQRWAWRRALAGVGESATMTYRLALPETKGTAATPEPEADATGYSGAFSAVKIAPLPQAADKAKTGFHAPTILTGIPQWVVFTADSMATQGQAAAKDGSGLRAVGAGAATATGLSDADTVAGMAGYARGKAKSIALAAFEQRKTVSLALTGKTATAAVATPGTAWLPPVWIDGGLWIRQSQSVTVLEDGSLEVM